MNKTPNHGLNLPEKGAERWHLPLNDNFNLIDSSIKNISTDGSKFQPDILQISESIVWPDGTKTSASPTNKTYDVVVAVEDGITKAFNSSGQVVDSGTNSAAVIQSAVKFASGYGGGVVKIGPGEFTFESSVTVPSNVNISGSGMRSTYIKCTGANQQWQTDGPESNIVISDMTMDGQDNGNNTGFNLTDITDGWCIRLESLNAGGRDGDSGSTPAIRMSGGTNCHIVGCRVSRSSSVSIEAAIRSVGCEIVNCTVLDGVYNPGAGFTHGISIEKGENCRITNCHVQGSKFSPALNANNADYSTVANNTVRNAIRGIHVVNGPCYSNAIVGNALYDIDTGILINSANNGDPRNQIVVGNVIEGNGGNQGINISSQALVNGNIISGMSQGIYLAPNYSCQVIGNQTRGVYQPIRVINDPGPGKRIDIISNHFSGGASSSAMNNSPIQINANNGIFANNTVNVWDNNGKTTVDIANGGGGYWFVSGNYMYGVGDAALRIYNHGYVTDNIIDNAGVEGEYVGYRDSTPATVLGNIGLNGAELYRTFDDRFSMDGTHTRQGTYNGDGSRSKVINLMMDPSHVVVEEPSGTKYDVHTQWGMGHQHDVPTGELSIVDGGFEVSGENLNMADNSYRFYAE
ncbi:right-handed parallel beta-helix repeat-containing protein [Salinigranum halophilum]|uniref:NosD domain-containing protein n=1 Tax=Salinigranum halophilum TaxID=2565931 RepID=UPI0010A9103C|nr:NosD domain-containing protein [Salinigranum halophilum]